MSCAVLLIKKFAPCKGAMIFFWDAVQFFAFIVLNISGKSHRAWSVNNFRKA